MWPLASRRIQAGRKEFFLLLCCDLANLPAVIKQTFCGMCWWTITTLIWSAWARRSQHPAGFFRVDGRAWCWEVLPSGPNIHCYYLIEEALGWDSASYYWSVLMSRKEIVFFWRYVTMLYLLLLLWPSVTEATTFKYKVLIRTWQSSQGRGFLSLFVSQISQYIVG